MYVRDWSEESKMGEGKNGQVSRMMMCRKVGS